MHHCCVSVWTCRECITAVSVSVYGHVENASLLQGCHSPGKPGIVREFKMVWKTWKSQGILSLVREIFTNKTPQCCVSFSLHVLSYEYVK